MKTASLLLLALSAAASLTGCAGYPMTVEYRAPPSAAQQQEMAAQQAIRQQRQMARTRSGGK